jgi:hypothetical protein
MKPTQLAAIATFVIISLSASAALAGYGKPKAVRDHRVDRDDLGRGAAPNTEARKYTSDPAVGIGCADDDAGHIIANNLGGTGRPDNMFPQSPTVNRGEYAQWERQIAMTLAAKDERDLDGDDDDDEHLYEYVKIDVTFEYGDKYKKHRPTYARYCYTPFYMDEIAEATGRDKDDRECRRFSNPKSNQCMKDLEELEGWDDLLDGATEHMEAQKHLRNPDAFLKKRDMKKVNGADIEDKDGPEARKVHKTIRKRQKEIKGEWDDVDDTYAELIARFKQFEKIDKTEKEAAEWRKRLERDRKGVRKSVEAKQKPFGSKKTKATFDHNKKKHEELQRSKKCDDTYDAKKDKPDCIVFKTCTAWEFYPESSVEKSKKRATAMSHANKLSERNLDSGKKSKWNHCFEDDGPTDGKGFVGKVASYRKYK